MGMSASNHSAAPSLPFNPMNYFTILLLTPILAMLDGFDMQNERIVSLAWEHDQIVLVEFPYGEFRRIADGGWVLSINSIPTAIFPNI